jgi:hypothetical protein
MGPDETYSVRAECLGASNRVMSEELISADLDGDRLRWNTVNSKLRHDPFARCRDENGINVNGDGPCLKPAVVARIEHDMRGKALPDFMQGTWCLYDDPNVPHSKFLFSDYKRCDAGGSDLGIGKYDYLAGPLCKVKSITKTPDETYSIRASCLGKAGGLPGFEELVSARMTDDVLHWNAAGVAQTIRYPKEKYATCTGTLVGPPEWTPGAKLYLSGAGADCGAIIGYPAGDNDDLSTPKGKILKACRVNSRCQVTGHLEPYGHSTTGYFWSRVSSVKELRPPLSRDAPGVHCE